LARLFRFRQNPTLSRGKDSAVEEELHRRYKEKFGELPKYVKHT
jgi:hypothetical protein